MYKVSPAEAVWFGFQMFFKKFFFFLGLIIVSGLVGIVGFMASIIVTLPFLFPLFRLGSKFLLLLGVFKQKLDAQTLTLQIKGFLDSLFASGIWAVVGLIIGSIILAILSFMIYNYLTLGWTKIAIEMNDKGHSSIKSLFSRCSTFFKYFFSTILYNFILWLGLICSISIVIALAYGIGFIPRTTDMFAYRLLATVFIFLFWLILFLPFGYWLIKFYFYGFFIADKNNGSIEALKKSYAIPGGFLAIFLMMLLFIIIHLILGTLFDYIPFIGFILMILLNVSSWFATFLAGAFLYRRLTSKE